MLILHYTTVVDNRLQGKNTRNALQKNLLGIEREALRIKNTGCIATTRHPQKLGSPLTHKYITTDFSESLIEIVTPPLATADESLKFLQNTLSFTHQNLQHQENLWPASMPCVIRGQTEINIAQYGTSNIAKMKETYRKGLAHRYGKAMQVVAGIHFNYSFSDEFWREYQIQCGNMQKLRVFKDNNYMGLIRNVLRYGWILYYYFGASNSVCKNFLHNYQNHNLQEFDTNTLYEPFATSLRMGDIGYQNTREDEAGIKANYNSICQYSKSLQSAIQTPFAEYEKFENQQLNKNILQIENEYYSSVRPKPHPESGIMPSISLEKNGIAYIELRGLDINPLHPLGISKEQILFLESFLLFCLTTKSKPISSKEQVHIDENNQKVAHSGLDSNLTLTVNGQEVLLTEILQTLNTNIVNASKYFSEKHTAVVKDIINTPTPSQIILTEMRNTQQGFWEWHNTKAQEYQTYFQTSDIDKDFLTMMQAEVKKSFQKTKHIEATDVMNFDDFLKKYYSQLYYG
jgi:glutamate--cysteine ligase